jgi:hypothetical protein
MAARQALGIRLLPLGCRLVDHAPWHTLCVSQTLPPITFGNQSSPT